VPQLLRVITAGSVDDGKSTLVGRLLYDTQSIADDHIAELRADATARGLDQPDLALVTDALRAEREQGITIDVAYRYFATARRSFVLADSPGHEQYTRNMATAASNADVAVLLTDLSACTTTQTTRHLAVLATVRVPHVVLCVNKIDLASYDAAAFLRMHDELLALAQRVGLPKPVIIPVSARNGDNVVHRSSQTPWYAGPSVLEHLECVEVGSPVEEGMRLPVQLVLRDETAGRTQRWYAGRLAAGRIEPGTSVTALPGGAECTVTAVRDSSGPVPSARRGTSVAVTLDRDIDLSRGGMITTRGPAEARELRADVCWLSKQPLKPGAVYELLHTTRWVRAVVERIEHRLDIDYVQPVPADQLQLNDIGSVMLRLSEPVFADRYTHNRHTGSFVLVDDTAATVGGGMVRDAH
jgi:sulfate adenylyltransferase subunit 1